MPTVRDSGVEQEITLHDGLQFVESQDVPAGASTTRDNWAYRITGPEGYIIFVQARTIFAPEFRDSSGDPLDDSTRVIFQKCDKQGNPLSEFVLEDLLGGWDYERMRTDPDYFRKTTRDLMLDEREIAKIFVDIPSGSNDFSADQSRLTVGDDTSDFGTPVEIVDHDELTAEESAAVKRANTTGGS